MCVMGVLVESQRVRRGHRFYPEAWQWAGIPGLLGQDGLGDRAIVFLHYFVAGCDWWVSEVDAATGEAFGWADLGCGEFGYICLPELEAVTVGGLVVERDLDWAPVPLWQALGRAQPHSRPMVSQPS